MVGRQILTIEQILAWADAHHQFTGKWPSCASGAVLGVPGETWIKLDSALKRGSRGLPGGESLAQLLHRSRGYLPRNQLLPLRIPQILNWADAHFRRFRQWPSLGSGRVTNASHELWCNVNAALQIGFRGLPGGSSLAKLLVEHRGIRVGKHLPALSLSQILTWADRHFDRTGEWVVLTKTRLPRVEVHAIGLEERGVRAALSTVRQVWSAIRAGLFYPSPSAMQCANCPFARACAAFEPAD